MDIKCRTPGQTFPIGHVVKHAYVPTIRVVSVAFASDHRKLLNWKKDWTSGGAARRFPKPEWTIENMACGGFGFPVSHSMDQTVVLDVVITYDPAPGSKPVKGDLVGLGPDSMTFVAKDIELHPGDTKTRRLTSIGQFQTKRVFRLPFRVEWRFWTQGVAALETVSVNHVFMTMNEPKTPPDSPGVTLLRMHHSVEELNSVQEEIYSALTKSIDSDPAPAALRSKAAEAILDPHKLVEKLVYRKFNFYDPNARQPNAWVLGKKGTKGDCFAIARYVRNVCLMVGMPGQIEAVRVWPRLNDSLKATETTDGEKKTWIPARMPTWNDFTVVETPIGSGGLDDPIIRHPIEKDWTLALIDHKNIDNNYEACVKVTHQGTKYYLPGALPPPFATDRGEVLPRMFKSLSWVQDHKVVVGKPPIKDWVTKPE